MIIVFTGCSYTKPSSFLQDVTEQIDLNKRDFIYIKSNSVGTSYGLSLALGIITVIKPSPITAVSRMYKHSGVDKGKAYGVINVMEEHSSINFLVFSFTKVRIRADFIEFVDKE